MAVHTCKLEESGSSIRCSWPKSAVKIKVGDTVKFVSEYGNVRLEFGDDCPFLADKITSVVAFYVKKGAPLSLKVKRLGRGKSYHFLCTKGEPALWDPKHDPKAGGDVPPSKPPG